MSKQVQKFFCENEAAFIVRQSLLGPPLEYIRRRWLAVCIWPLSATHIQVVRALISLKNLIMTADAAPAPATPKAAKPKKVSTKAKKPSTHPTYGAMAKAAISALKERTGSSRQAILKYIMANYNLGTTDQKRVNGRLKIALKNGLKKGAFKNAKGTGVTGSFKLADKPVKAKKPKAAKKAASPKKAKAGDKKPKKKAPAKKAAGAAKKAKSPAKPKAAAKKPKAAKKPAEKKAKPAKKAPAAKKPAAAKKPKAAKKSPAKKAAKAKK